MKLFELFERPVLSSARNLNAIAAAARDGVGTKIMVGEQSLYISARDARFVHKLYETAIANGTEETFLKGLVETVLVENAETLSHIVQRFPKEVKDFEAGNELDSDLYEALFDYYMMHGEMPYGVAKGRTGDPFNWVTERFEQDLGAHDNPDHAMEAIPVAGDTDPLDELMAMGMFESKKSKKAMGEGWEDMVKAAKERSEERKTGDKWKTSRGEVEKTSTGVIHRRAYDPKTGESDEPKTDGEGKPAEKRGRGRPRKNPVVQDTGPKRGRGRPRKNPAPDPTAPKRPRGRPRKVREWIETLRFIAEGK